MRFARFAALAAVAGVSFVGYESPASAAACVAGSVATYTAPGFSCNVEGVTFSNISVTPTLTGATASVTLNGFTVFDSGGEFGLNLIYTASATAPGDKADIAWTMNVSGNLLHDALLILAGNTTGDGQIGVNEQLVGTNPPVSLSLNGAGQTSATFAPVASLFVIKDDFALLPGTCPGRDASTCTGFATSSVLTNAYSLTNVPIPGAVGLFATGLGMMGLLGWRRKRNTKAFA